MPSNHKSQYFIGTISGTSMDSIDSGLFDFNSQVKFIAGESTPIPKNLVSSLRAIASGANCSIDECAMLDIALGNLFATSIKNLLDQSTIQTSEVIAIGCHGQTIRHQPENQYSLQIANPNIITAKLNIPVVFDFRGRDIAGGGQGAPLAPAFHREFFQDNTQSRSVLNIGGISNLSILPSIKNLNNTLGFDTGPGNCLMDLWCRENFSCDYDVDGIIASKGKVIPALLKSLLQDKYLKLSPPKSTGSEYFNSEWLKPHINNYQTTDVLRTLVEFTATCNAEAINTYAFGSHVYVCGGGAYNKFLLSRLKDLCQTTVSITDELGISAKWVEAALFAWLAKERIYDNAVDLTTITGAKKPAVLGTVCC